MALGLLTVVAPTQATTPTHYHLFTPPPRRSDDEARMVRQLIQHLAKGGAKLLREDGHLDAAAWALLTWAEAHENETLPQNLAHTQLLASGTTEPAVALFAVHAQSDGMVMQALTLARKRAPLHFTPTHLGFAKRHGRAVLLVSRRVLELAPIAKCVAAHEDIVLAGRVPKLWDSRLILGVQNSEGHIFRRTLDLQEGNFRLALRGPSEGGSLDIEVMGDVGRGLEIFNHFPIATCSPLNLAKQEAERGARPTSQVAFQSDAIVRATLVEGIQNLRARADAPRLYADLVLERLATAHAHSMCRESYFAHRDAKGQDAQARLRSASFSFRWVFENLAVSDTAEDALAQWIQSPLHLQNLLDARADSIGIGISRSDDAKKLWLVVLLTASR